MTTKCLQAAQLARQCGISVLPPKQDGSKAPDCSTSGTWTQHQSRRANEAEIDAWYATGRTGLGFVCGKVSGNLEVIDFDDRSTLVEFQRLCSESGLKEILDRVMAGYFEHTPNGAHLLYRCDTIQGNFVIAGRPYEDVNQETGVVTPKVKPLIETRGEGGYIIVSPTHGSVNKKGEYVIQTGGPESIVTITPEERQAIFDAGALFDERPPLPEWEPTKKQYDPSYGDRPGDAYNKQMTWEELLPQYGWRLVYSRLGCVAWGRPDKKYGISATTNFQNSDLLYVFSSSTGFEPKRGYSKFSAYSLLEHGSDFRAAAKHLSLQGYGSTDADVDLSGIYEEMRAKSDAVADMPIELACAAIACDCGGYKERKHPPIEELMRVTGMVGDLMDWMNARAHKKQPILALGASIAAMSAIIARKVQTRTGLRSNLYVVGIGNSGSGKDESRKCIKWLFDSIGAGDMLCEDYASGPAIDMYLRNNPASLCLLDEMGHFMGSVNGENTSGYVKAIIPMLLKLYESVSTTYKCTTKAGLEMEKMKAKKENKTALIPDVIEQPSLSLWATSISDNFFSGMKKEQLNDGFLGRLLIFESKDPDPLYQKIDIEKLEVPQSLKDGFTHWLKAPTNPYSTGDLDSSWIKPRIVEMSNAAERIFDDLESQLRIKRKQLRDAGMKDSPYMRVHATAMKLALIRACGIKIDNPEITESDARWGADLAWLMTDLFYERFLENVSENKHESNSKRVKDIIDQDVNIAHNKLLRKTRWLKASELLEIIYSLESGGDITKSKKGKCVTYHSTRNVPRETSQETSGTFLD